MLLFHDTCKFVMTQSKNENMKTFYLKCIKNELIMKENMGLKQEKK